MRICFISHQAKLEGAERSLLELISYLQERDVWIGVVVGKEKGPLMDELSRLGVPWKSVPFPWWTRRIGRPYYPPGPVFKRISVAAKKIADISTEWQADIIYSNTSVIGAGAMAAVMADKPHIWHIREAASQPENFDYLIPHQEMELMINQLSNRVIFNSKAVQKEWTSSSLPVNKTNVIYNRVALPGRTADVTSDSLVDVIIPMHNDPLILNCLETILQHQSPSLNKVFILDDWTTDDELIHSVQKKVSESGGLLNYQRNQEHLGFVGTCNRGMMLSENDVILLNSDTRVTSGWVEKLKKVAHHRPDIATATPMSNNASLVSIPELYENNPDEDPDRTNHLIESFASYDYRDIPTCHGFCVYLKREAIRDVGVFDRETFGVGYGEENDLSMRMRQAGWRNVASCKTYIYHKGAQSFGSEKRKEQIRKNYQIILDRYPEYKQLLKEFRETDPFKDLREPLRILRKNQEIEASFKIMIGGSVIRWKGQMQAVQAVSELIKRGLDVCLFICGPQKDMEYISEIRQYAEEKKILNRVFFTGYLDHIAGMLHYSDLTLVCSSFEPFGRVTLESMLTGTPVVGAEGGGTSELIRDGENGLLYKPEDPLDLADKINLLIKDRNRLTQLGENAKISAEKFIRENAYGETILNLLRDERLSQNPSAGIGFILKNLIQEFAVENESGSLLRNFVRRVSARLKL